MSEYRVLEFTDPDSGEEFRVEIWPDGAQLLRRVLGPHVHVRDGVLSDHSMVWAPPIDAKRDTTRERVSGR